VGDLRAPRTRGLPAVPDMPHNPIMARNDYKWDGNSRDERLSEFAHSGYSTTTAGEFHSAWAQKRAQRTRRARLVGLVWPLLAAVGVSAMLLYGIVTHLRV